MLIKPQAHHSQPSITPLRAYHPLDWLRLYIWLFFRPGRLVDHRAAFGKSQESRTAAWLASTLALLPLFIPLLSVSGMTWYSGSRIFSSDLLPLIVGLWLATSVIDPFSHNWSDSAKLVAVVVGVIGGVIVAVVVAVVVAGVVTGGMVGGVAVGVTLAASLVVAGVVAGRVSVGVVVGATLTASILALGNEVGGLAVIISGIVSGGVAIVGTQVIKNRLSLGIREPYWLAVVLGLLAPISYAVLIVTYF